MRRLPPLKAVRAFEAAARHESFADAADELAVTPSAVSQQVKILEDWLGRPLFRRLPRGLSATDAARAYLPALTEALDTIEAASHRVAQGPETRTLKVTCLASFGAQWLTPRLYRFDARHPDIDVMLATFDRVVDLEREDVDIAIRYGSRDFPTLHVEELMSDRLGVVCSPGLAEDPNRPIRTYADLADHVLLHDSDAADDGVMAWRHFLVAVGANPPDGPPVVDPSRGPRFSDSHMMIQACIAGRGVMIGRSGLITEALDAGILVAPFGMPEQADHRYRLAMRKGALADLKVAAFRDWIYEELGRTPPPVTR